MKDIATNTLARALSNVLKRNDKRDAVVFSIDKIGVILHQGYIHLYRVQNNSDVEVLIHKIETHPQGYPPNGYFAMLYPSQPHIYLNITAPSAKAHSFGHYVLNETDLADIEKYGVKKLFLTRLLVELCSWGDL